MSLRFETIGNATAIFHDDRPVLATDPWVVGPAYFGSWSLQHEVPEEQLRSIAECRYVWISHGHPDHLSVESLAPLKDKPILLADHVGGRIAGELASAGFRVTVLPDREWTRLSPRIRVLSVADYNQDSILLVEIGRTLVVNLNDAGERGWEYLVRRTLREYDDTILLQLFGFGEGDMVLNVFDDDGERIDLSQIKRFPIGAEMASRGEELGVRKIVPFSSLHRCQRADSDWANVTMPELADYRRGFESERCELLPAYVRYDCLERSHESIDPPEVPARRIDPVEFGDDWDEPLEKRDVAKLDAYFRAITGITETTDFVSFQVGGLENRLEFRTRGFRRGVRFEVPRGSLMGAIEHEVFDDLLLSNFARIHLEGDWPKSRLRADFVPYAKYADNGQARTAAAVRRYFAEYRRRAPLDFFRHRLPYTLKQKLQARVDTDSALYRAVKQTWRAARRSRVFPW